LESLWLLVALDSQCIFRQALLYLESNDVVESAELVVGDYLEVDWKLVGKIFVELWIPHEFAKSNNSKLYNSKFFLGSTGQPRPSTPEWVHTDATVRDYD
jgi:hypothetical protein